MKKVILAGLILIFGSDCCAFNILPKGGLPGISAKKAVAGILATVILGGGPLELAMRRSGTFKKAENSLLKEYVLHHIDDSLALVGTYDTQGDFVQFLYSTTGFQEKWEYKSDEKNLSLRGNRFLNPYIIDQPKPHNGVQAEVPDQPGKQELFAYNTLHPYTYVQVSEEGIALGNKVIQDSSSHTIIKQLAFDAIFYPTYPQKESNDEVKYITLKNATSIVEYNKQKLLKSGDAPIIVLFDNSLSRRGQGLDSTVFGLQQSESDPNLYEGKNHWGIALMSIRENMRVFYRQSWFKRRLNMISKVLFGTSIL